MIDLAYRIHCLMVNRKYNEKDIFFLILILIQSSLLTAQDFGNDLMSLSQIQNDVRTKRISSSDVTYGNADCIGGIEEGDKVTLMDVKGAGIIQHIWITINPKPTVLSRNDLILRMYWDGNSYPSVEAPLGPFFGNGWSEYYPFYSLPLIVAPHSAYVCYFSMPFSQGARIEIENQAEQTLRSLYYYIDYIEMDNLPENSGRFHAWFNHEVTGRSVAQDENWKYGLPTGGGINKYGEGNYIFADIKGKGHLVGVNYYVNNPSPNWYGEGDDMIFIDGEKIPSLNGTGTEDYFNTSWSPKELFMLPYFGYARVNDDIGYIGRTHLYRFHITDPVYFSESCRYTIEHQDANMEIFDLASVAYWYQEKASKLPLAISKEDRKHKPLIHFKHILNWRGAWLKEMGGDPYLWGDERKER